MSEAAQRGPAAARGTLAAVLTVMFLVSTGYFMVTPLLALDLTVSLHVAAAVAGVLVGTYVFVSQAMQITAGLLITRYGLFSILVASCAVAVAGYLLLAIAQGAESAAVAIVIAAVGSGSRTVSMKVFVTLVSPGAGARALTLRSLVINGAAALGPFLGVLLLREYTLAFTLAGLVNILLVLLALMLRKQLARQAAAAAETSWRQEFEGILLLLRHPLLRYSIAASIGFWLLYSQLSLAVPLYAHRTYHSASILSVMFVLNAVLAALVQGLMLKRLKRQFNITHMLAWGMLVTGFSFLPLLLRLRGAEILIFVAMFTLGEAIVTPLLDTAAGLTAGWSASAGSAFGLMAAGWAIGGLIGNGLGGLLFTTAAEHGRLYLLWLGFWVVGCSSAALVARARADPAAGPG